jgi:hypothetical protein
MIVAGIFALSNPVYGAVFGALLIAGGIAALIEKPKTITTTDEGLPQ